MKQRHLIMIVADQLRADVLGKGYTPNIDSIAKAGIRFENTYCGSPLCVPARGSLFTGLCPNSNGSRINPWFAPDSSSGNVKKGVPTLYGLMEEGGWDCIHSGKQHLFTEGGKLEDDPNTRTRWLTTEKTYKEFLSKNNKRSPGGPRFRTPVPEMAGGKHTRLVNYSNAETGCYEEGEAYYFDGYFTDRAIEGLQQRNSEKPLFLSAMFLAPHPPLDIPEPWYSKVKPEEVELPKNVGSWYPYQSPLQMYNLTGVVGSCYTLAQWKESWRVYLGLVSLLDHCVGRLLDELRRQGLYDESLIVFTSDHGEMLGAHRLFQKMCMYEESARVPLYMKLPGDRCSGRVVEDAVSHLDVLPTLCECLGIKAPVCEGRSLVPLMEGEHLPQKDVYIQFDGNGALGNFQRCVVRGEHKLIVDIFKDEVYYELYDTQKDPQETTNQIFEAGHLPLAQSLLYSLMEHMQATHDEVSIPNTDLETFAEQYQGLATKQGCKV